jgi:hypothetical protein
MPIRPLNSYEGVYNGGPAQFWRQQKRRIVTYEPAPAVFKK